MKTCRKCKKSKPLEEFHKRKSAKDGLLGNCKSCQSEYTKSHYSANKDYYKSKANKWRSENRIYSVVYNLTDEQYNELYLKYDGKCWICKVREGTHIDHDHSCCPGKESCGKCVRGLLCSGCNLGLGHFKDNVVYLNNAIQYLLP